VPTDSSHTRAAGFRRATGVESTRVSSPLPERFDGHVNPKRASVTASREATASRPTTGHAIPDTTRGWQTFGGTHSYT
jgi:hypothetical protein